MKERVNSGKLQILENNLKMEDQENVIVDLTQAVVESEGES